MCAICGIVNFDHAEPVDGAVIKRMTESVIHRGPDDDGFFVEGPVGLGFRRLSIIGLSDGHQPIFNEDDSAAIICNGEIYNYRDLSAELSAAGHTFRTRSDIETILHAYEQYGDECVERLRGMFAFAIWDRRKRRLLLARDRLGIKPLYYYSDGHVLAFASEIKSLLEIPSVPRDVDLDALDQYLSLRYVPGPRTMFKNVFRLQPGHTLVVDGTGVRIRKYWDIHYPDDKTDSQEAMVERFRSLLDESVRLHLASEVPLGVFLSGGLDSSAILAMMGKMERGRIKTFSVGYEMPSKGEEDVSEFEFARLAAKTFDSDHHEYHLTAKEFEEGIPNLIWHLDEPMADPSCIPLHFISKLAREHITVVLSGEGADEILAGYGIYPRMLALERMNQRLPALERLAPWAERITPSEVLRQYVRMSGQPLKDRYRGVCRGFRPETKRQLIGEDRSKRSNRHVGDIFGEYFKTVESTSPLNRMLYVDSKMWLPDDLLVKADKMTMANRLELRVPFLDHKLVEFAAALPDHAKLTDGRGKALLRKAMRGILPDTIIDRPKKGFPVPLASWLRGPMRGFTRDHLLAKESACGRHFDRGAVERIVKEHEGGRKDRSEELWTLLVLEVWNRTFIENSSRWSRAAA
jgi:asparagine synthase (glutamine-hydrolysing)